MMFLQYCIPGATAPILSHYLKNQLHFDPVEVGFVLAMLPVAAIVAPLAVVHVANRLIDETRLLSVCHAAGGILCLVVATQKTFWPFLIFYFCFGLAFMPTFALTNSIALHNVADARKDFGRIRFWGPVSWVVVAFGFSFFWLAGEPASAPGSRLVHSLVVAAIASFALAAFAFALPRHASHSENGRGPGWNTFRVFQPRSMIVLCAVTLLNSMIHQIYYYGMGPYLSHIGFSNQSIMPAMSLGQAGEMAIFSMLAILLARFGVKRVMIIGILAQVLRCVVFVAEIPWLTVAVIPVHGLCFACYFAVAFIYVDNHSGREHRAGAQQLFNIITLGVGNLLGSIFAGYLAKLFTSAADNQIHFAGYWLTSAGMALALGLAFAALFKEQPHAR